MENVRMGAHHYKFVPRCTNSDRRVELKVSCYCRKLPHVVTPNYVCYSTWGLKCHNTILQLNFVTNIVTFLLGPTDGNRHAACAYSL